jgi:aminopeptidase N
MYAWPKIVVADARDGMEYPMLTLDGGSDPATADYFVMKWAMSGFMEWWEQ